MTDTELALLIVACPIGLLIVVATWARLDLDTFGPAVLAVCQAVGACSL
jgi:hypothetical protein